MENLKPDAVMKKKEQPGYIHPRANLTSVHSKVARRIILSYYDCCQKCGSTDRKLLVYHLEKVAICRPCLSKTTIPHPETKKDRNDKIRARFRDRNITNETVNQIARDYNISTQRVYYIANR